MHDNFKLYSELINCPFIFCIARNIKYSKNNSIKVETVFLHSDGTYVDLFLNILKNNELLITDFGTTIDLLLNAFSENKLPNEFIDEIVNTYKVQRNGARLEITTDSFEIKNIITNMITLAQVCCRISNIIDLRYLNSLH